MFKPTLLLLTLLLALVSTSFVSAGHLVPDIGTSRSHPAYPFPREPLFACVIRSASCRSTSNYLSLHYDPALYLKTCHHEGGVKGFFHRLLPFGRNGGVFTNTFWVEGSGIRVNWTPRGVQETLEDGINLKTRCNAHVTCARAEDVDRKCFPKN
ncbi:hypothetical protein PSEUBRA_004641 [Kalmanozyma brasiliensis GHG001]|uniref:uncharacterized protein n=1 Tax=Kalmanozyma brasiliensis (strain GHG001) TaxID=1365824 RepID=UPI0028680D09|nr:uncharacterized protein PSEUBRA_004641 [Kalmanozyma brasiliensis GHG001]KAF6767398.1 hypothetical protein PSEUBRA_004641 [Kalmanozyma brasiliensis GHG001]